MHLKSDITVLSVQRCTNPSAERQAWMLKLWVADRWVSVWHNTKSCTGVHTV